MNRKIKSNLLIVFFLIVGLVSCISPFICTFFYDLYSTHVIIDYEARELNYHKITQESLHKKSEIRFGHTREYQVFEKKIINPNDTGSIFIREGMDIITLITCYPYPTDKYRVCVFCKAVPPRDNERK